MELSNVSSTEVKLLWAIDRIIQIRRSGTKKQRKPESIVSVLTEECFLKGAKQVELAFKSAEYAKLGVNKRRSIRLAGANK